MYRKIIRPLLFHLDPEAAHKLTIRLLRISGSFSPLGWFVNRWFGAHKLPEKPVEAFGIKFSNPIGLAAGYDKDGLAWRGLENLGFGHLEIGTVTPKPQFGNPMPRIFRIPEESALINRMGFPSRGADFVAGQLIKAGSNRRKAVIGVNIGKNKDTPNEEAAEDYVSLLKKFSSIADYLAVNISSPNTVGLRRLQARDFLEDLLSNLYNSRAELTAHPPLLVKISPDLTEQELEDVIEAILNTRMDGIIATNTTISRNNLKSSLNNETGGLSGQPLTHTSREMVSLIYKMTTGELPIIGVGGIMHPDHAKSMLDSGATLIQIYTGLVYSGPAYVRAILKSL